MALSVEKPKMTKGQKRLLWLVYIMGGVLVALFVFALGAIAWQVAHLH
jgi:fluoride ion exporter CrcB/FEX